MSSMIWEGGEQPMGGVTNENLSREAVIIQIRVNRWDLPEAADVTLWLLSIIRNLQ